MLYIYTTGEGKNYPIKMGYKFIESENIFYNYNKITNHCKSCSNYKNGGGCPPFAPKFSDIINDNPYSFLVYGKFNSQYKPKKVTDCKNYYIHYRFQDLILSNLLTNLGYEIRNYYKKDIVFLNNGFCMGCHNKCNFKKGLNYCSNPKKRTYSLEATGVNVEKTLKKHFGIELQWYNKKNYKEIDYMVKVIGLFFSDNLFNLFENNFINHLNNLKSTKYDIESDKYRTLLNQII